MSQAPPNAVAHIATENAPQTGAWRSLALPGFMAQLGPLLSRREGAAHVYGFDTTAQHCNPLGLIHGGVLLTLADQVMSLIAWEAAGRNPVVTMQLSSNFLRAVRPGERLELRGSVESHKGDILVLNGQIDGPKGRVMMLNGFWKKPGANPGILR